MFWLRIDTISSKNKNIGKLNLTSPFLKPRPSKSGFEASGLAISGSGGNTWMHALDLSGNHRWPQVHKGSEFSSGKWDWWRRWSLPAFEFIAKRSDVNSQRAGAGKLSMCNKSKHRWINKVLLFISFHPVLKILKQSSKFTNKKTKTSFRKPNSFSIDLTSPDCSCAFISLVRKEKGRFHDTI